jgi:hypothetical protein
MNSITIERRSTDFCVTSDGLIASQLTWEEALATVATFLLLPQQSHPYFKTPEAEAAWQAKYMQREQPLLDTQKADSI